MTKFHRQTKHFIPSHWKGISVKISNFPGTARYHIKVDNRKGVKSGLFDGQINGKKLDDLKEVIRIKMKPDTKIQQVHLKVVEKNTVSR